MENSGSFSLESSLPKSFFSSFSSSLSINSTWKPILSSLQENQRLNRLIQVRETKLQELSTNQFTSTHSQFLSHPIQDDFPLGESDRLTEILSLSQKNLKVLSFKVGSLPKNLIKAMDLVLKSPQTMTDSEKIECLSGIELLQEKLSELVLNSDEILGFFKDIALECEATGNSFKTSHETLLRFADKREEIFVSKEMNRAKIQNLYRLIMNLESWKCRKGVFVEEFDSNSRIKYEECVKETLEELGKKEQELRDLQGFYKKKVEILNRKVKGMAGGLKKLKHCVEFEIFSSWSCLAGHEFSYEPSCLQVTKQIRKYQDWVRSSNLDTLARTGVIKSGNLANRDELAKELAGIQEYFKAQIVELYRMCQRTLQEKKEVQSELESSRKEYEQMKVELENTVEMWENKVSQMENEQKMQKKYWKEKLVNMTQGLREELKRNKEQVVGFFIAFLEHFQRFCGLAGVFDSFKQVKNNFKQIREDSQKELDLCIWDIKKLTADSVGQVFKTVNLSVEGVKSEFLNERKRIESILAQFWSDANTQFLQVIKRSEIALQKERKYKEVIEKERNELASTVNKQSEEIAELKNNIKSLTEECAEYIENAERKFSENTEEKNELIKELQEKSRALKSLEEEIKQNAGIIQETQSKIQSLTRVFEGKLGNSEESISEFQDFTMSQHEKVGKLEESSPEMQSLCLKLESTMEKSEAFIKDLKKKCSENELAITDLKKALSSKDSNLSQLEDSLKSSEFTIIDLKKALSSKDLNLTQLQDSLKSKETELESTNSIITHQNSRINSLNSALSKLQALIPAIKALQALQKSLFKETVDQKSETLQEFDALKSLISNTSQSQESLNLQLISLQSSQSHLQSSYDSLFSQLQSLKSQNQLYVSRNKEKQGSLLRKLAKQKRKLKAFAMILAHEKNVIKKIHQDVFAYLKGALEGLKVFVKEYEEGKSSEVAKVKITFEQLTKISQSTITELEKQMALAANTNQDLTEKLKIFQQDDLNLVEKLQNSEEYNKALKSELEQCKNQLKSAEKALSDSESLQKPRQVPSEKLQKALETLTNFRELNNTLRSSVTKLLQSSTFEIEGFRIKLFEQVKNDIGKIRKNLEYLMENYKEERSLVHEKIEKIKESVDLDRAAIEPVKGYLKENQENIDALNKTFERNSALAQKSIEENMKKLEDVCSKIEGFRTRGYELLSKYSKDVDNELFDQISEISEITEKSSIDLSENKELFNLSSVLFEDESKNSANNNQLLKMYNPSIKSCCRLPYLIKCLEKILNNKFKDDLALLSKNREPLTMSEYLIQSLYKESPALYDKKICELLNSFRENQSDSRVKFYCRLFQVFEPNPISYKLSLYLIKMRHFFNLFIGKQVIPESHKKRVDKMQVTVILKTTRKLFNSDIETGKVVLKNLKPENMINTVWSITCIDYYLYSKSLLPVDCFKAITQQETITEDEFVYGLSKIHDTFVNESDLHDLFNTQSTGLMTVEEFSKLFDLDSFFKRNQTYMVDQLQFLNALIEGYTAMRIRHYKEVEALITKICGKKQILDRTDVNLVLSELNSNLNFDKVFEKVEEVSARDLKRKIFELNIGGKGIGCFNLKSIGGISDVFED